MNKVVKLETEKTLDQEWLRTLCLDAGVDDVGFVEISRAGLDDQRADILTAFPKTKTLISFVIKMTRENIRTPKRSASNIEFHSTGDDILHTARKIVKELDKYGVRGLYPAMGFPMEMDDYPGKTWIVSHKPVAIEAGLGQMGIHRNIIHPKFGNFVLLGTILIDATVERYAEQIDYNPCMECKLCVAACPVGAIGADGYFDFAACFNHNYYEFMGGFTAYTEQIADSKDAKDLRSKVTDSESASWWQSLSFGANYKAAYCLAVCPAGDDVISPYLESKSGFKKEILKPLVDKQENVYVVPGTDAHTHLRKRFKHKTPRLMKSHLRPTSVAGFLRSMPLVFNRHKSQGLNLTYHFMFTGQEKIEATVIIKDKTVTVQEGLNGKADFSLKADSAAWLSFLRKDKALPILLLTRKIKPIGPLKYLKAFSRCFR
ncbi:4Fe-4S binding protein [Sneathiella aquimaris]|uniref:4Fe-4S binding protein n=1 Tax=Sneathiella aquimaris TaxID=2599305 RepID=UPI00146A6928|nr:4Fe-4S binding protein [Sneathiella aquimaris]